MFKSVLKAAEISRLRAARKALESRRFKWPQGHKKQKGGSFDAKVIKQTKFHNSPLSRCVRVSPRTLKESFGKRVVLAPYERDRRAIIRRRVTEDRYWKTGRHSLLNPPHGFEPALPDPQIFAEGHPSDLLSIGDRAIELNVIGGEFWRQFWNQAACMIDGMRLPELIDFLEMKEDSQYCHVEFLQKSVRCLVAEVSELTLNEIASIFTVYRHFNCYSFELMETLSRRATQLLQAQIETHRQLNQQHQDKDSTELTLYNKNAGKDKKAEKAFDPQPLSQILRSAIELNYVKDMLPKNTLLSTAVELLASCRLIHNFDSIAEVFSILTPLQSRLLPHQTQQLTMRVQLITAIIPERPRVFVSGTSPNDIKAAQQHRDIWNYTDEVQSALTRQSKSSYKLDLSSTVNLQPKAVSKLVEMISLFSHQHDIAVQPDVRDILSFNLASSIKSILNKEFADLTSQSPYLSQAPFACAASLLRWNGEASIMQTLDWDASDMKDYQNVTSTQNNKERRLDELVLLKRGIRRNLVMGSRLPPVKLALAKANKGNSWIDREEMRRLQAHVIDHEIRRANLKMPDNRLPYRCLANLQRYRMLVHNRLEKTLKEQEEKRKTPESIVWDEDMKAFAKKGKDGKMIRLEDATKARDTGRHVPLSLYDKSQKTINRISRHFVVWPSDQLGKRKKLFEDVLEPSMRSILTLWRNMAPIAMQSGVLQLMPTSHTPPLSNSTSQHFVYCDWNDRNNITQGFLFIPNYRPTAHEWSIIGASISAILRFGPQPLSVEGLCLFLEAITLRAICEASDRGALVYPSTQPQEMSNVSRDDSFFIDANVPRGLHLRLNELQAINLCCYEIMRKWKLTTAQEKYRICLSLRTLGFRNPYLHNLMVDDWLLIVRGGKELEKALKQRKASKALRKTVAQDMTPLGETVQRKSKFAKLST